MLAVQKPADEAKSKLCDKLLDIRNKTQYLHKVIDDISSTPVLHGEAVLKEVGKKNFLSQYIRVSQELEGCLGRLLVILDAVGSLGVLEGREHCFKSAIQTKAIDRNDNHVRYVAYNNITESIHSTGNMVSQECGVGNSIVESNMMQPIKRIRKTESSEKSRNRKVTCNLCGKTMRGNYELKVHMACRHTSESRSELKYVCMLCTSEPKRYARGDRLKEHIERIHLNSSNKHVCSSCGRGFSRPGRRNKHQMHCKPLIEIVVPIDNKTDMVEKGDVNELSADVEVCPAITVKQSSDDFALVDNNEFDAVGVSVKKNNSDVIAARNEENDADIVNGNNKSRNLIDNNYRNDTIMDGGVNKVISIKSSDTEESKVEVIEKQNKKYAFISHSPADVMEVSVTEQISNIDSTTVNL